MENVLLLLVAYLIDPTSALAMLFAEEFLVQTWTFQYVKSFHI